MDKNETIFPGREPSEKHSSPKELLIATNAENLKSIITSGLIRPKEGYTKYYKDLCEFSPGHIPIFTDKIPSGILSECQEEKDIHVVIISLKFSWHDLLPSINGYVNEKGEPFKGPPAEDTLAGVIFFNGVIPVSAIKSAYFRSKEEKEEFLAIRYLNFDHRMTSLQLKLGLFRQQHAYLKKESIHFSCDDMEKQIPGNADYLESDARGGVISMLMQYLPPFQEAKVFIKSLVNNDSSSAIADFQALPENLKIINNWIWRNPVSTDKIDNILLWHLLDLLAPLNCLNGITSSEFLDDFQQRIESSNDFKQHPKYSYEKLMARFKNSLRLIEDTLGIGDPDQFFQNPEITSGVLRGLLLFLLYKNDIGEFQKNNEYLKHRQITPADILFANILYAAWKGWKNIDENIRPKDKKTIYSMCNFMSNWHNINYTAKPYITDFAFSPALSGNFSPWAKAILLNTKWSTKLKKFAVDLSKKRDWPCIQTEIKGSNKKLTELKLSKQGDMVLKLIGAVSIKETIDEEDFKAKLKQTDLTDDEKKTFQKTFSG